MKNIDIKNVKFVRMILPVRYGEEDIPMDFPCRLDDKLYISVDHTTGIIEGFNVNYEFNKDWGLENLGESSFSELIDANIFYLGMKVTDEGCYYLLDDNKNTIASLEEEYVPDSYSIPGEYGDYLNLHINMKTGKIENWIFNATFDEFCND